MALRKAIEEDSLDWVRRRLTRVTYGDLSIAVDRGNRNIIKAVMKKFVGSEIEPRKCGCLYREDLNRIVRDENAKRWCNACYAIDIALRYKCDFSLCLAIEIHLRAMTDMRIMKPAPDDWFPTNITKGRCLFVDSLSRFSLQKRVTHLLQNECNYGLERNIVFILLKYGANPLIVFGDPTGVFTSNCRYTSPIVSAFNQEMYGDKDDIEEDEKVCELLLDRALSTSATTKFTVEQFGRSLLISSFEKNYVDVFKRLILLGVDIGFPRKRPFETYDSGNIKYTTDADGLLEYRGRQCKYDESGRLGGGCEFPLIYAFIKLATLSPSMSSEMMEMIDMVMYASTGPYTPLGSSYSPMYSPIDYILAGRKDDNDTPYELREPENGHDDEMIRKNINALIHHLRTFPSRVTLFNLVLFHRHFQTTQL